MSRKSERRRRDGLFEQHTFAGNAIQVWRRSRAIAIRTETVPARRIERDDHDVELIGPHAAWQVPQRIVEARLVKFSAQVEF